eukprot:169366_1
MSHQTTTLGFPSAQCLPPDVLDLGSTHIYTCYTSEPLSITFETFRPKHTCRPPLGCFDLDFIIQSAMELNDELIHIHNLLHPLNPSNPHVTPPKLVSIQSHTATYSIYTQSYYNPLLFLT